MKPKTTHETIDSLKVFLDGFAMYLFLLLGILASKYIPMLRENGNFKVTVSLWQFIVSCVVAFISLTSLEFRGDRKGKKKAFIRRASAAVGIGAFWHSVIGG